jgi:hypothetical protein
VRVRGHDQDVSARDYARQVGDRLAEHLATVLVEGSSNGVLPDPDEFAESLTELVVSLPGGGRDDLASLLGPFWSATRAREALGLASRQALNERRRSGSVLGLKTASNDIVYPVSQFQRRDGRVEVKPLLVPFLRTLRGHDPWAVATLLHTPAPELGGLTPLAWLKRGGEHVDALEDLARTVAREWRAGAA